MGIWNLSAPYLAKAPITVLSESFESFSGWVTVGTGTVSQSSAQAYEGTFSALKNNTDDPNGAYKLLSEPVQRNFILSAWIYSVEPRAGGGADRISIVDSSGNGYGFFTGGGAFRVERRDAYAGTDFSLNNASWTRPVNTWYRIVLKANSDNTFTTQAFDNTGTLLGTQNSIADTTHTGSFDRVAILGGRDYHVDNLVIKRFD